MKEREPDFSRTSRKRRRSKSNNILNALIGLVVVLIIITASIIFTGNKDEQQAEREEEAKTDSAQEEAEEQQDMDLVLEGQADEEEAETPAVESDRTEIAQPPVDSDQGQNGESTSQREETTLEPADKEEKTDEGQGGKVTYANPDDPVIAETIVNSSWKPIGTTQTGNHVSQYDGTSVDWQEKKQAIAYSTGIPEESLIYWKIKNGGSPQKSIGIVSTKDKSKKYQVHLEWVDGAGWKPVQMDVLNTLEFDY